MHDPRLSHWFAVKRILRYLKGTLHLGLQFFPLSDQSLRAYSDAGWAVDVLDRRSHHGYAIFRRGDFVRWSFHKQMIVACSRIEAEYKAGAFATAEVSWLKNLLFELGVTCNKPHVLLCDNISALYMCTNLVFHNQSKHIEIEYHFVREKVERGLLYVPYLPTLRSIYKYLHKGTCLISVYSFSRQV